jgi:hypothetical protein
VDIPIVVSKLYETRPGNTIHKIINLDVVAIRSQSVRPEKAVPEIKVQVSGWQSAIFKLFQLQEPPCFVLPEVFTPSAKDCE